MYIVHTLTQFYRGVFPPERGVRWESRRYDPTSPGASYQSFMEEDTPSNVSGQFWMVARRRQNIGLDKLLDCLVCRIALGQNLLIGTRRKECTTL